VLFWKQSPTLRNITTTFNIGKSGESWLENRLKFPRLKFPDMRACPCRQRLFAFGTGLFVFHVFGWSIGGWVIEIARYYYFLVVTLIAERTAEREPLVT